MTEKQDKSDIEQDHSRLITLIESQLELLRKNIFKENEKARHNCEELTAYLSRLKQLDKDQSLLEKRSQEINLFQELQEIAHNLNSDLQVRELLEKIVDVSVRFIQADRGFLFIREPNGKLDLQIARTKFRKKLRTKDLKISQTVVRKVLQTGQSIFVPDITKVDPLTMTQSLLDLRLLSVMCLPLGKRKPRVAEGQDIQQLDHVEEKLVGVLYVDSTQRAEESRFRGENLMFLQALADHASIALANAYLYERTMRDNLTQLYVRSYFEDMLCAEIEKQRDAKVTSVIGIVVPDYFRTINQKYGYQVGDEILRFIAQILRETMGHAVVCSRYRMDRFAVLFSGTTWKEVESCINTMFSKIEQQEFDCGKVSLCVGVRKFVARDEANGVEPQIMVNRVIQQAEEALNYSRNIGHNRSELWDQSQHTGTRFQDNISDILTGHLVHDYLNVEILLEAIQVANSTLDLKELIPQIMGLIVEITSAERGLLMLFNEQTQSLEIEFEHAYNTPPKGRKRSHQKIAQQVFEGGEAVCITETPRKKNSQSKKQVTPYSVMCIPIQQKKRRLGVIYVESSSQWKNFSSSEMVFLRAVTSQIASAFENAHLYAKMEQLVIERTKELSDKMELLQWTNKALQKQISERKRAEAQIKTSLREKEFLLKEIHHRVKNNLQVISSLLSLQSNYIKDQKALAIFKDSQIRVEAMALIHEKLYQSENLVKVDLLHYIQGLTEELFQIYATNTSLISISTNIQKIFLGIDQAIPCGLILNELISNSLKHAFPKGKSGEIRIELTTENDDTINLNVSDNGIGIPQNLDYRKTESLGLQIVLTLVKQLKATIELQPTKGTTYTIRFSLQSDNFENE